MYDWEKEYYEAIRSAQYGIFILTPNTDDRPCLNYELGVLNGGNKQVRVFSFGNEKYKMWNMSPFSLYQKHSFGKDVFCNFLKMCL